MRIDSQRMTGIDIGIHGDGLRVGFELYWVLLEHKVWSGHLGVQI